MKDADILAPQFTDNEAARVYLEAKRWPNDPVCPHRGVIGEAHRLPNEDNKLAVRKGVWKWWRLSLAVLGNGRNDHGRFASSVKQVVAGN